MQVTCRVSGRLQTSDFRFNRTRIEAVQLKEIYDVLIFNHLISELIRADPARHLGDEKEQAMSLITHHSISSAEELTLLDPQSFCNLLPPIASRFMGAAHGFTFLKRRD